MYLVMSKETKIQHKSVSQIMMLEEIKNKTKIVIIIMIVTNYLLIIEFIYSSVMFLK